MSLPSECLRCTPRLVLPPRKSRPPPPFPGLRSTERHRRYQWAATKATATRAREYGPQAEQAARDQSRRAGLLFDATLAATRDLGYRGPTACSAAGITYRQLDYWARTGLVEPTVRSATGSGTQRLYSFRDILVLKVVKRLLDTGISLQQIRKAVAHLRDAAPTT